MPNFIKQLKSHYKETDICHGENKTVVSIIKIKVKGKGFEDLKAKILLVKHEEN